LCTLVILETTYEITLHFIVNDIFMCFFFGIAAKELSEAFMKKGGDLRGVKGIIPLIACAGGVAGPALVYLWLSTPELKNAWAVPCATDIAFAWLGARAIWGDKHPAVKFLLALAIADDFAGMIIIAIFYPQHEFHWTGVALLVLGMLVAWCFRALAHRWRFFQHWQLYLLSGVLCWFGLLLAGLHAALALVFVVPFMPMAGRDEGIFAGGESEHGHDTVNKFEHFHKPIVDVGLFFFGLANAGVAWIGTGAWTQDSTAVFLGLGLGKTVGITAMTIIGYGVFRMFLRNITLPMNDNGVVMQWRDVPIAGILGAMGFTVALFVADAAGGHDALRIGALASFGYLAIGILAGRIVCRR
jgi:Na+:H+ antiporter, NhaA family